MVRRNYEAFSILFGTIVACLSSDVKSSTKPGDGDGGALRRAPPLQC